MAALLPLTALAKAPPHDAKTLTVDPPRIVREKAMHRHEQAGKKDDKWPPDGKSRKFYKALKELAPKSETTKIVLVLGGMVNQKDLDLAGNMTASAHANLVLYNNDAGDRKCGEEGTQDGVWCGQTCDELRLPPHTKCEDVPNMGRAEGAFFKYAGDHYEQLEGKQVVFSGSTVGGEMRSDIVPNLLNEAVADGTVVPRCFLGEYHSQLNAWDVWNFGFTKKCEGNGENDQWATCTACATEKVKAREGAVIGGTVFKSGLPCNISYLDCVGGHPPCKQRPQTVCAALPNTVGRWLLEHAPLPGGNSQAPACYRGAFRTNGEAIRRRSRDEYRHLHYLLSKCSNPEASHFVERAALYLFASF